MTFAARFAKAGEPYEGLAYRNESGAHWTGRVRPIQEHLEDPIHWRKPSMVFVNSMSDLFHEALSDTQIQNVFSVMESARRHIYQVLTKRPDRMLDFVKRFDEWLKYASDYPGHLSFEKRFSHVWLGVSVEDQKTADQRIPLLLQTPAAVRWISAEPLLGPIQLTSIACRGAGYVDALSGRGHDGVTPDDSAGPSIDWVVAGGESGPGARPMHPDWARSLRDQCVAARIPFFFKQWGAYKAVGKNGCSHDSSDGAQGPVVKLNPQRVDVWRCNICSTLHGYLAGDKPFDFKRVGKKAAGRLLDGRTWDEFPVQQSEKV